ncbi:MULTISPECIES: FAD-dependent oxidoreductase [Agrobacterium]|uniref:FAD-dependent oxidoreductase n=1 Tax=Agrobacterium rosae TaxID=1972867 RepID=A0A1R3TLG9_9HYPH|nr:MULTISPECIES: FAD-dependent oxidoreductase [Agrobacterium]KAA3515405.1 FAD-dependent oxidoreductase [Agrobacterium rosae]KAA3524371.1 FAD-dependent oxidoreductase [Agrobacterium rosae]MBN7804335.1 FAD-dependent oxidoreductase [Agrobacterium rosae]MCM2431272.1 FAD-dependent oxidoreductase [Agrobacterium rosae]MDX8312706.1 FAD-dependent oxidoreductase [Agrobacterium rosae]
MFNARGGRYDVVVVGGGAAGMSAAVASVRMGAKVALIERYGFLGGAAANSLVLAYCGFFLKGPEPIFAVGGIGADLLATLDGISQDITPIRSSSGNWIVMLDPEAVKFAFDRMTDVSGLDVLLHSRVTAVATEPNGISAITLTDHAGSYEITADAFVDASGDAVLASLAGLEMTTDSMAGDHVQPASMPVRIGGVAADVPFDRARMAQLIAQHNASSDAPIHRLDGGVMLRLPTSNDYWWMTIDLETDGLSGASLGAAERQARLEAWRNLQLLRQMSGFESAFIAATGPQIGIRETRRPRSREDLTGTALKNGERRDDGIGRAAWPMEVHEAPGRARFIHLGGEGFADIPMGSVEAAGADNLFLAGRVAGADASAYGSLRVMGTAFVTGHAAGTAAALRAQSASAWASDVRKQLALQNALI